MSSEIIIIIALIVIISFLLIKNRFKKQTYHGVIRIIETESKLTYSMELEGDPENLAQLSEARFKIISPDYEKLLSQRKPGV